MTPEQAKIHNRAIDLALSKYKEGIGAIRALKVKEVVTVDHVGTTTTQDVIDVES